jgi:hypothetical protein
MSQDKSAAPTAPGPSVSPLRAKRSKTWSSLGNLGRKPTEYEVVTHNMNHTVTNATPLEMGPEVHGNQWLKKHRDGIGLKVAGVDSFRDPDQMTYRKYTTQMDEQETYVDGLLRQYTEGQGIDAKLSPAMLDTLALAFTPTRYLGHGLQMISAYVQQLAHSSYLGNCAAFQTADQLRRVQRVAYRTRQLANAHPTRAFGTGERATWEKDADWQPVREAIERLMLAYDWDQAFVGLNLVIKPVVDELFLHAFADVARANLDELDAGLCDNLFLDAQRSRRWTASACKAMVQADVENHQVLSALLNTWHPMGVKIIEAGSRLLTRHTPSITAASVVQSVTQGWEQSLVEAGLKS